VIVIRWSLENKINIEGTLEKTGYWNSLVILDFQVVGGL
jgi:hypothetical protein